MLDWIRRARSARLFFGHIGTGEPDSKFVPVPFEYRTATASTIPMLGQVTIETRWMIIESETLNVDPMDGKTIGNLIDAYISNELAHPETQRAVLHEVKLTGLDKLFPIE